jgi:hypothetical protein
MATTNQLKTLFTMCQERGLDIQPIIDEDSAGQLTNDRVNRLFVILKGKPRLEKHTQIEKTDAEWKAEYAKREAEQEAAAYAAKAGIPTQTGIQTTPTAHFPKKTAATEGFYLKDDQVYKVMLNRERTRTYACKLVIEGDKPRWYYAEGMVFELNESHRVTPQLAKRFGDIHNFCLCCGRELTQPLSIERGVGPVCWGKLGF